MSPKYLDPKRFEELGLTLAKYQTATDAEIKSKAILLKSANLLFSVSVNRHHLTCIKMKKTDVPIEVRSLEDLLSLKGFLFKWFPLQITGALELA